MQLIQVSVLLMLVSPPWSALAEEVQIRSWLQSYTPDVVATYIDVPQPWVLIVPVGGGKTGAAAVQLGRGLGEALKASGKVKDVTVRLPIDDLEITDAAIVDQCRRLASAVQRIAVIRILLPDPSAQEPSSLGSPSGPILELTFLDFQANLRSRVTVSTGHGLPPHRGDFPRLPPISEPNEGGLTVREEPTLYRRRLSARDLSEAQAGYLTREHLGSELESNAVAFVAELQLGGEYRFHQTDSLYTGQIRLALGGEGKWIQSDFLLRFEGGRTGVGLSLLAPNAGVELLIKAHRRVRIGAEALVGSQFILRATAASSPLYAGLIGVSASLKIDLYQRARGSALYLHLAPGYEYSPLLKHGFVVGISLGYRFGRSR